MKRTGFWLMLLLLVTLLGACGGDSATGALQVNVAGLPSGTAAAVTVVGPNNFKQVLTESQTISGLVPGSYNVTASPVANFTATVSGSPATLSAGETTQVNVTYTAGTGGGGGSISGTVSIVGAGEVSAPFVPGEVIVKLKPGLRSQALTDTLTGALEYVRDLSLEGVGLYQVAPSLRAQSGDLRVATLSLIAQLSAREDVLYATPNYLLSAAAEPNDPLYGLQWHYRAINLLAAWDQTTGSADVTIAIIDSGIATTHPDLAEKLLPGYDFVSSADDAGDGDGRDGDPTDPAGSFHGSHVAGTAAAATNNGVGVGGVSWGARILPVRVLGPDEGTGTLADTIDGILWSVGRSVAGVPENPNPADVLNLSLGGGFACRKARPLQDAFDEANDAGAVVVVAAGNENDDARFFTPASCGNVIAVGATTIENKRAAYSNYGSQVDVMAPGGDNRTDLNNDGQPDGVLSTVGLNAEAVDGIVVLESGYAYLNGTSMSSPHVAGVAALLKSVRPALTTAEVRDVLAATAVPITDSSCRPGCGAGLVDASAALAFLAAPTEPDFSLSLSPTAVALSTASPTADVTVSISRSGGLTGEVAFSIAGLPGGLSASFVPSSTSEDSVELTLTAASGFVGDYALEVQGVSGGVSRSVQLSVSVTGDTPTEPVVDISGTVVGACYFVNNTCDENSSRAVQLTGSGSSAPYAISDLVAQGYFVAAYKDGNNDGDIDDDVDYAGVYLQNGQRAEVTPPADGIDITMTPRLGTQNLDQTQLDALFELWNTRPSNIGQE